MPEFLIGDETHLKQILINLVKNALKFTPARGNIKIISSYDVEKEMLQIHVIDNGNGIKPEKMDKIFQMFGKLIRCAEIFINSSKYL